MNGQDFIDFEISPEYYEIVGRISSDWALLELYINDCLWALSSSGFKFGACLTSQIYTFEGRIKALMSILKLINADESLIKKLNQFHENSRKALEFRNRAVHDVWGHDDGTPAQLTVTANKKLIFDLNHRKIDELLDWLNEIEECVVKFLEIRESINSLLLSFPHKPMLVIQATYTRHAPKRILSRQRQSRRDQPESFQG